MQSPENSLPSTGEKPLKIAYLTAGAAGMICGSCLHDNTLARALIALGHDVQLMPLYTPIRTDEEDVSNGCIYYGGINMYLQQKMPLFRWLPKWLDRWLDQPWLINWAAGKSVKIDPQQVADLTLSILRGSEGFQKKEVERLADWLTGDFRPDVVVFSNILTAGCVPEVKRRMNVPVVVTLQGDDIFLRGLPEPYQAQALAEIRHLAGFIDGFIVNSRFYADAMAQFLGLDPQRISLVPLGIDTTDFQNPMAEGGLRIAESEAASSQFALRTPQSALARPPTIGYLARLAPEKGLHILANAFIHLRTLPGMQNARLRIAGWLGDKHRPYVAEIFDRLHQAGLDGAFDDVGEIDRRGKLEFLSSLDVLAVPTTYEEPKGLFMLEALAAGVPVVMPDHGAFPEVLAESQGGLLHRPGDPMHLAERLHDVLSDATLHERCATSGRQHVHTARNARQMALRIVEVLRGVMRAAESRSTQY
jgi:glycosyltransferase involved in cell wall biosynthesis